MSGLVDPQLIVSCDADTWYDWVVTVTDEHGAATAWRESCRFRTVSTSPPHDPFPADGSTNVPIEVTLSWVCSDPDGDDGT